MPQRFFLPFAGASFPFPLVTTLVVPRKHELVIPKEHELVMVIPKEHKLVILELDLISYPSCQFPHNSVKAF